MKYFLLLLFMFSLLGFHVQAQEKNYIQFSGMVKNVDQEAIPFVHIVLRNTSRGSVCDKRGMFSIIVEKNDTLIFSSVGYKMEEVIIPGLLQSAYYSQDVIMENDTIKIDEVVILPWKTYEEFKQAFVEFEVPENDLYNAQRNFELIKIQALYSQIPDPGVNFKYSMQQLHDQKYFIGQYPPNNLLNPIAWAKFIKALKSGAFSKKNKKKRKK